MKPVWFEGVEHRLLDGLSQMQIAVATPDMPCVAADDQQRLDRRQEFSRGLRQPRDALFREEARPLSQASSFCLR